MWFLQRFDDLVGTTFMASTARAKQCAVPYDARSRKKAGGWNSPYELGEDAINVVPTSFTVHDSFHSSDAHIRKVLS